jgi:DNA polymerase III subunit chi
MACAYSTAMYATRLRVDFYQLSRDPAERAVALIARNAVKAGERMLIVSDDSAQLARIDDALWQDNPEGFLAHGMAGGPDDARQPILLASSAVAANGARFVALADGVWRDSALAFDRAFLLFSDEGVEAARATWRAVGEREGSERHFWKQEGGKWVKSG